LTSTRFAIAVSALLAAGAVLLWWAIPADPAQRGGGRGNRTGNLVTDLPEAGGVPSPAVMKALDGPAGDAIDAELRRRAVQQALEQALARGDTSLELGALGGLADPRRPHLVDGWGTLDPAQPVGTPHADGAAQLRALRPEPGPMLVQSASAAEALSQCVVRGWWCLVVSDDDAAGPAWEAAANARPGTAAELVDRAGASLLEGVDGLWIAPDTDPQRVRLGRR
jgi:hypothetical protein